MTNSQSGSCRFDAPAGGVDTREVGAISGEVEAWLDGDEVKIRYAGAEDVYTVSGSCAGRELGEVVEVLTADPGVDADGNPRASSLE